VIIPCRLLPPEESEKRGILLSRWPFKINRWAFVLEAARSPVFAYSAAAVELSE